MSHRLSLCIIAGNESAVIERCLRSFAPAFDELSLVIAVGAKPPDQTEAIARKTCAELGKSVLVSRYENAPDAAKWEHVDDFAAARNKAFEQATGDYLFWCDCDDIAASGIAALREIAPTIGPTDICRFPYDVIGSGKRPFRERLISRALFESGRRWRFPVHENLLAWPGDNLREIPDPVWLHAPIKEQTSNRNRNLRVLGKALKDAPTQFFYWHQELNALGRVEDSKRSALLVMEMPNLEPSFRYQAALNLVRMTRENEEALRYALRALEIFPWAREAKAELLKIYMELRAAKHIEHWATELLATPEPSDAAKPWTHEPKFYAWLGYDLAAQAWRMLGNAAKAAEIEAMRPAPEIALLHATRGREQKAVHARSVWLESAIRADYIEHIYALDADDEAGRKALGQFRQVASDSPNCVGAWNAAARAARAPILVQVSDDFTPPVGWDVAIMEEIARAGKSPADPLVVAVSDGHRTDDLLCMAICTRARYRQQGGELFAREYEGVFSDNEFSYRAFKDGIVIDARSRLRFTHAHPFFDKSVPVDETYAKQNSMERYRNGRKTFLLRNPEPEAAIWAGQEQ